jgi:hypothetical protein
VKRKSSAWAWNGQAKIQARRVAKLARGVEAASRATDRSKLVFGPDKAVELWWAIKNVGASARDEPRFVERMQGTDFTPALFATKHEAATWKGACGIMRSKIVRVEVREV